MSAKIPVPEYLSKYNLQQIIEDAINECYESQSENPTNFLSEYFTKLISQDIQKNPEPKIQKNTIDKLFAREILDSRGNPTIEVDVLINGKVIARESSPSGASTGSNEALELRDVEDTKRFAGKGVLKACGNVNGKISEGLKGMNVTKLKEIDDAMCKLDGDVLKKNLGGNALTACSFSCAVAGSKIEDKELFIYLYEQFTGKAIEKDKKFKLPIPCANILNGGKHAGGKLKLQEFMICPKEGISFKEQLRYISEVYQVLAKIVVEKKGKSAKNVGDEGGYAPDFENAEEAVASIEEAIKVAGYEVGKDIFICLDAAASEFYNEEQKKYELSEGKFVTSEEMVGFYEKLVQDHPEIISIEDGLDEKDYEGWQKLTEKIGSKVQIVGDDLYTTNTTLIKEGLEKKWANALLLKVNQIGTISEAMDAAKLVMEKGQNVMVSHRSGETGTNLIADLAVAIGAKYIKTGAPARGERVGKYNRLLVIEEILSANQMLL